MLASAFDCHALAPMIPPHPSTQASPRQAVSPDVAPTSSPPIRPLTGPWDLALVEGARSLGQRARAIRQPCQEGRRNRQLGGGRDEPTVTCADCGGFRC
jgi:hypothetical protein